MKISYNILNSKAINKAVLIHGLFASSGYWLEYLKYFKEYKLLIFNIDYNSDQTLQSYIDRINLIISKEFDGEFYILISHSFGTLIANGFSSTTFRYSFEICPVHSSTRIEKQKFINEISRRLNAIKTHHEIALQLQYADVVLNSYQHNIELNGKRILLYPDNDIYFKYNYNSINQIHLFKGDHFNIDDSLRLIFTII